MSQDAMSAKQQEILEYIKDTILKKGYPPAVREICQAVHLKSTSSVHSHLAALEEKDTYAGIPRNPGPLRFWTTRSTSTAGRW